MSYRSPPMPRMIKSPPRGPVLCVAPHPDDEIIGPGGALLLHADAGDPIRLVFVCNGVNGDPDGHYDRATYVRRREDESRAVARDFLRTADLHFYGYPDSLDDGGLSTTFPGMPDDPDERRRALVHGLASNLLDHVRAIGARTVYYPWSGEFHSDHWAVGAAVDALVQGTPNLARGTAFLGYEVWSTLLPTVLVNITPTRERKLLAVRRFETQMRYFDYATIVDGLNAHRGLLMGHRERRWAEAFIGDYGPGAVEEGA